jgi:phosphoenolpyruvate carboxylase
LAKTNKNCCQIGLGVTEQGEIIAQKYNTSATANLERLLVSSLGT